MLSGFPQLPRELRDQVYRYLIPTVCFDERGQWIELDSNPNYEIRNMLSPAALPILYTCHQVHDEASSLFFQGNKFFYYPRATQHIPASFQEQSIFRANVNQIKHLRLALSINGKPNTGNYAFIEQRGWLAVGEIADILKVGDAGF